MKWDVFISYANEDKESLVRPFVRGLIAKQLRVWFDEVILRPGDRLREAIDEGLRDSRYAIIVLSRAYLRKNWTRYELDGLLHRFVARRATLLPIWHGLTYDDVASFSLPLADIVALNSRDGVDSLLNSVIDVINPSPPVLKKNISLREVFRAKIDSLWDRPARWEQLFQKFQDKNTFLRLVIDPAQNEEESEYRGWLVTTYRLIDYSDQPYFLMHYRKEWLTESDDWLDFSEPREIIVYAFMPVMQTLIDSVIDEAGAMEAEPQNTIEKDIETDT